MNICYYNWSNVRERNIRGGGVDVYQRNILKNSSLIDGEVFFISSGCSFTPPFKKPFFVKDGNCAVIYNSNTIAPASFAFASPEQLEAPDTEKVFISTLASFGNIDILHFNNLEGIPVRTLKIIKEKFPKIKIVLSLHNYYTLCPQVDLFFANDQNCINYDNGKRCLKCAKRKSATLVKSHYYVGGVLDKFNIKENDIASRIIHKITRKTVSTLFKEKVRNEREITENEMNSQRRDYFIDSINKYVDLIIPVSKRVEEIFIRHGINGKKSKVIYIGTAHSSFFNNSKERAFLDFSKNKKITLCYLGYMRKSKGFPFLLEALGKLDQRIAKNINLVIAAKKDNEYLPMLYEVAKSFNKIEYHDGYTHNNLSDILKNVDLGIVPPIWEDNLPQVAIEMHCRHIPILTSDLGGASELHNRNKYFTFRSGDVSSFNEKLIFFLSNFNNIDLNYFENSLTPISLKEHLHILNNEYMTLINNK
ncbi:glycosyltransferase [Pectobacterium parmentieri]|uniref:glycosyltransferase n=1 Tax=Pectobacterium parmentieri TaxID=1905730 RepID=UPI0018E00560|nr:glycosyltransferase [Pectobacterium parmentieri]MBI0549615.1 glycosyltransferase family 4 protein [Pectobacterium parmentieri]MBI0558632.1 glycosyltransferase family 4 protein [Pectobacterium parmentieri]MBI0562714.1 glycosyltransferase family 4 protein [Pectobacterium parmentieri]